MNIYICLINWNYLSIILAKLLLLQMSILNNLYKRKKNDVQGFLFSYFKIRVSIELLRNDYYKERYNCIIFWKRKKTKKCFYYLVSFVDNDDDEMAFLIPKHRHQRILCLSSDRLSLFTSYWLILSIFISIQKISLINTSVYFKMMIIDWNVFEAKATRVI